MIENVAGAPLVDLFDLRHPWAQADGFEIRRHRRL